MGDNTTEVRDAAIPKKFHSRYLAKRVVSSLDTRLDRSLGWIKIKVPVENDDGAMKKPSVISC